MIGEQKLSLATARLIAMLRSLRIHSTVQIPYTKVVEFVVRVRI